MRLKCLIAPGFTAVDEITQKMSCVFRPLQMVQEVQEGVVIGFRTGVQHGHHGEKAGVCVFDVYRGEEARPDGGEHFSVNTVESLRFEL